MTQVKPAQDPTMQLARFLSADHRSLAERRAAFAAQMRDMALSDLKQVSHRLKGLHKELEAKDGRQWTHYDLAQEMGIRPRTFQSWENGEVENRNGKGYDKMARFYTRKLGRKITRQWIVFGAEEAGVQSVPTEDQKLSELSAAVSEIQEQLQEIAAEQARLLSKRAAAGESSAGSPSSAKRPARPRKSARK